MKKIVLAIIVSTMFVFANGCKVVNSTAGQPTAYNNIVASNDALAVANEGIADSVISLNASGTISESSAAVILKIQKNIASTDILLANILNAGPTSAKSKASTIIFLLNSIKGSAASLLTMGIIPTDPKAELIINEISSIISLSTAVLNELALAGVV